MAGAELQTLQGKLGVPCAASQGLPSCLRAVAGQQHMEKHTQETPAKTSMHERI